ncbi:MULTISPECIES: DUF599 domain-containing protein [unclassified Limnohabitans]|jgi:uncharacterized membrane protein|uniref:DUF599 domain-containing protein n=1 Tax=unclassified Limnohabitans TaxID=2626134 RepID=UPI000D39406C|nr:MULTISPECIES: DUF599 domain-containing protein [unclassified Limnohabitans]PUE22015.1 hypothetical protein B9Z43_02300 [Limnohabitans sp. MMS-10A-192]PUE25666.1 hypothetical protein B9Z38_04635 [Limnohabitans sp. MMS-10A-160]
MKILTMMPWGDWLALVSFFSLWVGYAWFARVRGQRDQSLIATTNAYRVKWMLQTTARDPRMLDGLITQNLSHTPSFFSSTTIIIIGGLFALLGTTDKAAELVREIPFAHPTPMLVFEFKVLVLVGIFVYAFFRFSWSMRQYTFVALMIGAMPPPETFDEGLQDRQQVAERAGRLVGAAAETFNDGLRAYYFSFAAMAWFFSPLALVLATALVVMILYGREFHSEVLQVLRD